MVVVEPLPVVVGVRVMRGMDMFPYVVIAHEVKYFCHVIVLLHRLCAVCIGNSIGTDAVTLRLSGPALAVHETMWARSCFECFYGSAVVSNDLQIIRNLALY